MFPIIPRRMALLGALVAIAGCTALQQVPIGPSSTGIGTTTGTTSGPTQQANTIAAPAVASLALEPATVELNAPYSYGGYQSETTAELSEREVAGYPTIARLWLTFLDSAGKRTAAADIDWASSQPELVSVDRDGWIRSVDPGTSGLITITARLKSDPTISATTSVVLRNDGKLSLELK